MPSKDRKRNDKSLEEQAVRYIAGYAINHTLGKKSKCANCLKLLRKVSNEDTNDSVNIKNSQLFMKYKTLYSSKNLTFFNPSDSFFNV